MSSSPARKPASPPAAVKRRAKVSRATRQTQRGFTRAEYMLMDGGQITRG